MKRKMMFACAIVFLVAVPVLASDIAQSWQTLFPFYPAEIRQQVQQVEAAVADFQIANRANTYDLEQLELLERKDWGEGSFDTMTSEYRSAVYNFDQSKKKFAATKPKAIGLVNRIEAAMTPLRNELKQLEKSNLASNRKRQLTDMTKAFDLWHAVQVGRLSVDDSSRENKVTVARTIARGLTK